MSGLADRMAAERAAMDHLADAKRAEKEAELAHAVPAEISQAADILGVPAREIKSVAESDQGDLEITTTDGVGYVLVPSDRPDGDGKTGLMVRRGPQRLTLPRFTERPHNPRNPLASWRKARRAANRAEAPPAVGDRRPNPEASTPRLTPAEEAKTQAQLDARRRQLPDLIDTARAAIEQATSVADVRAAQERLGVLEAEQRVISARWAQVGHQDRVRAEERESGRKRRQDHQTAACFVELEDVFGELLPLLDKAIAIRAAALAAGADPAVAPEDLSDERPDRRPWLTPFRAVDTLAYEIRTVWPRMLSDEVRERARRPSTDDPSDTTP